MMNLKDYIKRNWRKNIRNKYIYIIHIRLQDTIYIDVTEDLVNLISQDKQSFI